MDAKNSPVRLAHRPKLVIGLAGLSVIAAVIALVLVFHFRGNSGPAANRVNIPTSTAVVPSVVGDTENHAEATLRQIGYVPEVHQVKSQTTGSGTIVTQNPPAGSRLIVGSGVILDVSTGP